MYWCQALHITNKDSYQNNERPRALALLNSPLAGIRACDPWICNQAHIYSQTHYQLCYAASFYEQVGKEKNKVWIGENDERLESA